MNNECVLIQCIEVKQPIGVFYVGKMQWKDLIDISYGDVRRIVKEEDNEIESSYGIQRDLSKKRLKEISEYVTFSDATFPTSIVLAISSIDEENDEQNIISYDKNSGLLKLKRNDKIAKIIDGQHRVFGLKMYSDRTGLFVNDLNFELIVTIFVDIDLDNQSMIFATINKAQTKVNNSLVYDLFDLAKTRSPYRTCHNIVKLLNLTEGSPLKDKIKMLGKADDPHRETITQATLVENIVKYISHDPLKDRDLLKRGRKISYNENDKHILFFRKWFIYEEDEKIAKIIWDYLSAVKRKWPKAWTDNSILVKSTGIISLMKFLPKIINKYDIDMKISEGDFYKYINRINLHDSDFNTKKYIPGATGQNQLYNDMITCLND